MRINCFRPASGRSLDNIHEEPNAAARQPTRPLPRPQGSSKSFLRRNDSDGSRNSSTSTHSNASIARLPPCKRLSDAKIEAMMMPVPHDARPSRCLRLSRPKVYADIVADMKAERGTRDWRSFDVIDELDEVNLKLTADAVGRDNVRKYARKHGHVSCGSGSGGSIGVDMIG